MLFLGISTFPARLKFLNCRNLPSFVPHWWTVKLSTGVERLMDCPDGAQILQPWSCCYSLPLSLLDLQVGKAFSRRKKNEGGGSFTMAPWSSGFGEMEKRHAREGTNASESRALSPERYRDSERRGTVYKSESALSVFRLMVSVRNCESILYGFLSQRCSSVFSYWCHFQFSSDEKWNLSGSTDSSCFTLPSPPSITADFTATTLRSSLTELSTATLCYAPCKCNLCYSTL